MRDAKSQFVPQLPSINYIIGTGLPEKSFFSHSFFPTHLFHQSRKNPRKLQKIGRKRAPVVTGFGGLLTTSQHQNLFLISLFLQLC